MIKAYLSMGSNLGDRYKLLNEAIGQLKQYDNIEISRVSPFYETEPWGVKNQNKFLNIAIEIETELSCEELLLSCQQVEKLFGRNREKENRWGERTLDIDIIFYGNEIVNTKKLCVPHKFMHDRAFVLVPLMDLIPNFVHPILKKSVSKIYDELDKADEVVLYNQLEEVQL